MTRYDESDVFLNTIKIIEASCELHRSYFVSRNRQSGPPSDPGANLIATLIDIISAYPLLSTLLNVMVGIQSNPDQHQSRL